MLVKDVQELLRGTLYRVVELSTYRVRARSWSNKGVRQYVDREVKLMDTTISNYGTESYPVINVYI